MTLIVIVGIAAFLFALAFITKRRFGVLGMALCAGALLSEALTPQMTAIFEAVDLTADAVRTDTMASVFLLLLPALMLLFAGPRYESKRRAVFGALGFAALSTILALGPLSGSVKFDEVSKPVLNFIATYESAIIAVAVSLAVIDMMLMHAPHIGASKKH